MLDINIGHGFSNIRKWHVITVFAGFISIPIFFIVGIVFILNKSFDQTTIVISFLITALVTGIMLLRLYFRSGFLSLFFGCFILSTTLIIGGFLERIIGIFLGRRIPSSSQIHFYSVLSVSILFHFIFTFGLVGTIQGVLSKII
jgi:hypothetical protein